MSKMIQIRHVPDALHHRLRTRAALAGMTLSDYLKMELEDVAARVTPAQLRERLGALAPARVAEAPAQALKAERRGR